MLVTMHKDSRLSVQHSLPNISQSDLSNHGWCREVLSRFSGLGWEVRCNGEFKSVNELPRIISDSESRLIGRFCADKLLPVCPESSSCGIMHHAWSIIKISARTAAKSSERCHCYLPLSR